MKKIYLLLSLSILNLHLVAVAQETLTGYISDYTDGKGLIISKDIVTGDKFTWGKIDDEGMVSILLKENHLDQVKKWAVKAQKKAPKGFTVKLPTVEDIFTCRYSDVEFENPDNLVSGLPDLMLSDKKKKAEHGIIYPVNDPVIADWLHNHQQGEIVLGYYLMFYFSEGKSSAIGTCMTSTYTGLGDENFDKFTLYELELDKGWNIVQFEIEEVFESKNGGFFPEVIKVTKLDNMPDDVIWFRVR